MKSFSTIVCLVASAAAAEHDPREFHEAYFDGLRDLLSPSDLAEVRVTPSANSRDEMI